MAKVRSLTRRSKHRTLAGLLRSVNPVLRGWCNYFRHGVSAATFRCLTPSSGGESRRDSASGMSGSTGTTCAGAS